MLVLYVHFAPPDNVVHIDRGRHVLRAVGYDGDGTILFRCTHGDGIPSTARVYPDQWFGIGPVRVCVRGRTPHGVRLTFEHPASVSIELDRIIRRRRQVS